MHAQLAGLRLLFTIVFSVFTLLMLSAVHSATVPGNLSGELSVGQNGAANYSITISVPPGAAGMQPSLSLNYSSRGGNGLLGTGWSLGGLSVVHRCPKTQAQDGERSGISLTANDKLCIDGQRLIAVTGTYGADGTEYRTEIEGFSKIVSYGAAGTGPAWFKVWTKSGQIMEYGNTADSRIEAQGKSEARLWAVNRIEDTVSNYLTVSYFEDSINGEYYPTRIDYSGNIAAGTSPDNSVQFVYQDRPDSTYGYQAASKISQSKRLQSLQVYHNVSLIREIKLTWSTWAGNGLSRLDSIEQCDSAGNCFSPTTITWENDSAGGFVSSPVIHSYGSTEDPANVNWADVNGDGMVDWVRAMGSKTRVRLSLGDGTFGPSIESPHGKNSQGSYVSWQDVNADGLADWVRAGGSQTRVRFSNGDGTFGPIIESDHGMSSQSSYASWADINGDGLVDWVRAQGSETRVRFSNGDGTFGPIIASPHGMSSQSDRASWADINGDGMMDWVRPMGSSTRVRLSLGDGTFGPMIESNHGMSSQSSDIYWQDINGDGMADWLRSRNDVTRIRLSLGDGAFGPIIESEHGVSGTACNDTTLYEDGFPYVYKGSESWADINGDGMTDWVCMTYRRLKVRISLGDGTFGSIVESNYVIRDKDPNFYDDDDVSWVDINGDGLMDWILPQDTRILSRFAVNSPAGLLSSIDGGSGAVSSISYKPLTDNTVYTKGASATYPEQDVMAPMYIVSQVDTDNGNGGVISTTYAYSGMKVDLDGRGLLGFASMTSTDVSTGIKTTSNYRQDFPYTGQVSSSEKRLSDDTLIYRLTNTYAEHTSASGKVHFPYVSQSVEESFELNGSPISTVTTSNTYDTHGSPTHIIVNTSDGTNTWTTSTTNTYTHDESKWHLGRLTQATVTKSLPNASSETRNSSFTYDSASGLLITETIEPGTGDELVTTNTYDAFGNKTAVTISSPVTGAKAITARTTTSTYDTNGKFAVSMTNALGHTETKTYDSKFGSVLSLTGPNGLTTSWTYDGFGRKLSESRADGTSTTWSYDFTAADCPADTQFAVTETISGAGPARVCNDKLGRETRKVVTGFDGTAIYKDTVYNSLGQVDKVSRPYYAGDTIHYVQYTYDTLGRVLTETNPDTSVTTTTYNGLSTTITNDKGQATTRTKNAIGQRISVVDPANSTATYEYDPYGNLIQTTDEAGNVTLMSYDVRGNKISMNDPDMGIWSYTYNVLGELVGQTDAKNQSVSMVYDKLGRMVSRTEPEGTTTWAYDTATKGIGKLTNVTAPAGVVGYSKTNSYDGFGRPSSTTINIGGTSYTTSIGYDAYSRVETKTYPTGFATKNIYNVNGQLYQVINASTSQLYWQADAKTAEGQLKTFTYGNGVITNNTWQATTGYLTDIKAGKTTVDDIQHHQMVYDSLGNHTSETDYHATDINGNPLTETYTYDNLNRITSAVNYLGTTTYEYDALGNITYKSDVGYYSYGLNAGPHAVTQAGSKTYTYDANGSMLTGDGKTITWTSFNKPTSFVKGNASENFTYGPDRKRIVRVSDDGTNPTKTVYYIGSLYEKQEKGGVTSHVHYIDGGGKRIAIHTEKFDGANTTVTTNYIHHDHKGSTAAITDENGIVLEHMEYDSWGARRNHDWSAPSTPITSQYTDRGYTDHEHLDTIGLIHMNGRVYDPTLGRFLSADPNIQFPGNMQSWNRYSYVLNNPHSYTDPSGFFLKKLFKSIGKAIKKLLSNKVVRLVAAVAAAYFGGPGFAEWALGATEGLAFNILSGAAGGFAGGFVGSGGDIKAAIHGGITGAAFGFIGGSDAFGAVGKVTVQRVLAHGVVGGVSSRAAGGSFGSGFISGAFAKSISGKIQAIGDPAGQVAAAMVAGGVTAELGGGKFANGALSAAFGYIFNHMSDSHVSKSLKEKYLEIGNAKVAQANSDPNAIIQLNVNELETISKYMSAKYNHTHSIWTDSDNYFYDFQYADSFLFHQSLVSRVFDVVGHGQFYGGEINYLAVGIQASNYNWSYIKLRAAVNTWNTGQFIVGQGAHNLDTRNLHYWAKWGFNR